MGAARPAFFIALDGGFPLLVNPRVKVAAKWRPMLTAEDTVRRIGASPPSAPPSTSPAHSASGPEPAAAIARRRGGQPRRAPRRGRMRRSAKLVGSRSVFS
jgi:hypothetical protein